MQDNLMESNFLLYAAKHYDNPQCIDIEDFYDDLKRFKYIKRLFRRYKDTGDIKERLVLNHIIVLNNVFGPEAATKMLLLKLDGFWDYLKPFLVFTRTLPDNAIVNGNIVHTASIQMDAGIVERLRNNG